MHLRSSLLGVTLMCSILASAAIFGNAWSQPGTVLAHTKINSDTLASFGATLDDGDEFGDAVASLGDLDGPGPSVTAVAVGTIGDDDGGTHRGAVYVFFLNTGGNVLSYQKISSTQGNFTGLLESGDEFGGAVSDLGDLDGPGPSVTALAVGAFADDDGGTDRGAVYILFLDSTGNVLSHQKISSTQGNFTGLLDDLDEFGGAVAGLGDLDGPGPSVAALAVGAIGDDDGGPHRGATYILFLDGTGNVLSHEKISSTQDNFSTPLGDNDDFGEDLANLGDLDGPGPSVLALAVSAVSDDDGGRDRGAVYVLFLNAAGNVLSFQKISNTQGNFSGPLENSDNFGSAVIGLGDLDGPDPSVAALAVSATSDDGLGYELGAVYILLLDATANVLSYQEISSTAGNFGGKLEDTDEFGGALAALGDIDGTGQALQTLISSASYDDDGGTDRGAIYLLSVAGTRVGTTVSDELLVHMDSPNGGEELIVGSSHELRWAARASTKAAITTIDLYVSSSGAGGPYSVIATGETDDGTFTWTPPGSSATNNGPTPAFTAFLKVVAHDASGQIREDVSDAGFSILDRTTPTQLALFQANPVSEGVEIRWMFVHSLEFSSMRLERSEAEAGPWAVVSADQRMENGATVALDRSVEPGRTYYYKLVATTWSGGGMTFGPLSATAEMAIAEFALGRVMPNPGRGRVRFEYAVPREAQVRLSVVDVTGREVAVLAEGMNRPGHYQGTWEGKGRPGVYFVRLQVPGRDLVQRVVVVDH